VKIQLITDNKKLNKYNFTKISSINEPAAFDMYDVNIIDLSYKDIWKNKDHATDTIDCIKDFDSIKRIIYTSKQSTIIITLPQNVSYCFD
jgi:hypothetical protein